MQQPSPDRTGGSENQRPPGVISLNNVQIMRPGVPIPQKSVATVTPRVIVGNPRPVTGPATMSQEMQQNMAGPSQGPPQGQGHVLVKSDGRYQLVRVGAGSLMPRPANLPAMGGPQVPIQSEVMVPMSVISAQGVQTIQPQQIGQQFIPQQFPCMPQPMQMQMPQMQMAQQQSGTMHVLQAPQAGFSQGTPQRVIKPPESSKDKCRNFLANLLELSSKEPPSVERNVRQLIQELIDGTVEAADFCNRLERLLNANSQPCLVGFLMKSLPLLRQSMAQQELVIPGVRPPPLRVAYPQPPQVPQPSPAPMHYGAMSMPENIPQMPYLSSENTPRQEVSYLSSANIPEMTYLSSANIPPQKVSYLSSANIPEMTFLSPANIPRREVPYLSSANIPEVPYFSAENIPEMPYLPSENIPIQRKVELKRQAPAALHLSMFEDKVADDDINDVAAMGGVNLAEESQRILGDMQNIGSQIHSCGEERPIEPSVRARLRAFCLERELTEPSDEVAQYFTAALYERIRIVLTYITGNAAYRLTMECKDDERYEVSQDVKGQLKFLEDLDRVEKRRREESEREMLLRAAKSRSKTEDPEQAKLKAKAKEMQRAEMEEVRQREANLTALQAIGPRKKARTEPSPAPQAGPSSAPTTARRSRLLRVTLRDMLYYLENDKTYAHSTILYMAYLKG